MRRYVFDDERGGWIDSQARATGLSADLLSREEALALEIHYQSERLRVLARIGPQVPSAEKVELRAEWRERMAILRECQRLVDQRHDRP